MWRTCPGRIAGTVRPPSSSRAWARAASLSGWPDSMRESSTTRSSPATGEAEVSVRPAQLVLVHGDLLVGLGRHLGQVGDHQHLARAGTPRAGPRRATRAAAPPTPASTSSKTMVCGPPMATRRMASMARASSPPEAALARGSTASPTLAPSAISIGSPVPSGADPDLHPRPGHGQVGQALPHQRPELLGGLRSAPPAPCPRPRPAPSASSARVGLELRRPALGVLQLVEAGGRLARRRPSPPPGRRRTCGAGRPGGAGVPARRPDVRDRPPIPPPRRAGRGPRRTDRWPTAAIRSRYSSKASRPASRAAASARRAEDPAVAVARRRLEELRRPGRPPRGGPRRRPGGPPPGAGRRPRRDRTAGRRRSRPPGSAARRPPGPGPARRPRGRPPPPRSSRSRARRAQHRAQIGAGIGIEHGALGRRGDERLVGVLAVDLDQFGGGLGQGARPATCARRPTPASGRRPARRGRR